MNNRESYDILIGTVEYYAYKVHMKSLLSIDYTSLFNMYSCLISV